MIDRKFPQEHTEKVTPANNDWIPLTDSADNDNLKKIKYSNLKGPKGDPITWKGSYNAGTAYAINDAVSYNGVSYICILASTGNLPTNTTYWAVMVQVSSATDTGQGAVRLADAAQSIAGTDMEASEPLVPQPSHIKAVRDLVASEALKIKSKEDVHCATTANITLSGTQTIDGYSAVAGNRVLVKDQSTASQNGIYVVAAGAWTRAVDFDSNVNNEVDLGASVWVSNGTVNGGTQWTLTTTGTITVGTTSISFTKTYPGTDIGCKITTSTSTSVTFNSWAKIPFETEAYDTGGFHDNVTNNTRITIPSGLGGTYVVSGQTAGTDNTCLFTQVALLVNNTTEVARSGGIGAPSGTVLVPYYSPSVSTICRLSAGDYVELQAYNSTGSSKTISPTYTYLSIQKIA